LTGFPFQDETLRYRVVLPVGKGFGDITLTARRAGETGWDFSMSTKVDFPVWPIADLYQASATGADLCSTSLRREISHGGTKVTEQTEFDQKINRAERRTVFPEGGGRSDFSIPTCGRDALTYLFWGRRELGQGRMPPQSRTFFGPGYDVRMVYTGEQSIPVAGKATVTDHINVSVKGPASDITFEIFYARDAARTPLVVKIPVSVGSVSLELVH
jgi:hypothetical protein